MMKYLNLEHSVQIFFFLKYRIKCLASVQVTFFSNCQGCNVADLAFWQLADIPLVASQKLNINVVSNPSLDSGETPRALLDLLRIPRERVENSLELTLLLILKYYYS